MMVGVVAAVLAAMQASSLDVLSPGKEEDGFGESHTSSPLSRGTYLDLGKEGHFSRTFLDMGKD